MAMLDIPNTPAYESSAARLLHRVAAWQEARYRRRLQRVALGQIPENLRDDLGLDGGAALRRPSRGTGRTFVHRDSRDGKVGGWFW